MNRKRFSNIIVIAVIGLVIVVGGYFVVSKRLEPTSSSTSFDQPSQQNETANWKTYKNEEYGFEFKYPLNLTSRESGGSSDIIYGERVLNLRNYSGNEFYSSGTFIGNIFSNLNIDVGSDQFHSQLEFSRRKLSSMVINSNLIRYSEEAEIGRGTTATYYLEIPDRENKYVVFDLVIYRNDEKRFIEEGIEVKSDGLFFTEIDGKAIIRDILSTFNFAK